MKIYISILILFMSVH